MTQVVSPVVPKNRTEALHFARRLEDRLDQGGHLGRWALSFTSRAFPLRFNKLDEPAWIYAMVALARGDRVDVDGCDVWRAFSDEPLPNMPRVLVGTAHNFKALEPVMRTTFGEALDGDNQRKLTEAHDNGFDETHLVVWHQVAGDTSGAGQLRSKVGDTDNIHSTSGWLPSS